MLKSRQELKNAFLNGTMPDQEDFADMIDSLTHVDEFEAFVKQTNAALENCEDLGDFPQAKQWMGMGGRIGLLTQTSLQAMPSASGLVTQAVPANGQWQSVLTGLNACYAFELLACAQGPNGSKNNAMVHAIILTTFSGKPCSIQCTHTYQGWNIFRRMRVKWKKSATGYDLLMRSGHDFGKDENGKPVQIQFHLSRLW